ncbi:MAG: hypothetical protein EON86_01270 [Brevundimonas sp.]|nr:MAG: hypothetical protein EON86_01270 [Brevundimonas sp.]
MVLRLSSAPLIILVFALASPTAARQAAPPAGSPAIANLSACRAISVASDRLSCFDRAAMALDAALQGGDILVVDRRQATAARREAFGSTIAPADILQPPRPEDRIDAIETTLTRATQSGDGRWTFVLADGSTWNQTDTDRVRINNRAGETVRVRRGALGSYLLVVGRSGAVRVRRQ